MTDTVVIGSANPNWGVVQTNAYLDRMESLPYSQIALSVFGEIVDIPSYQAETHTIRSIDQISINNQLMSPINVNVDTPDRVSSISGSNIVMKTSVYGVSLLIAEYSRVNSPENIFAAVTTLLADYEMRLKEKIIYNTLQSSNLIIYQFTQGGASSKKKANIVDLIDATTLMEENEVAPCLSFITASPDEYTRPVPERYALVTSVKGAATFKKNIGATDFTQTHRYSRASNYGFVSKGTVERANVEIFASTEIDSGTSDHREAFIFGAQPFYKTGKTPLNSKMIHRPATESVFGLQHRIEKVTVHGVALSNQNRIIKIEFAD